MKSIEDHIEYDKKLADDPQANPAARRHAKGRVAWVRRVCRTS